MKQKKMAWKEALELVLGAAIALVIAFAICVLMFAVIYMPHAEAETAYVCVAEGSHLNARSHPVNGKIEARLLPGWQVEVLTVDDGWAQLEGVGESGTAWVAARYLSEDAPGTETRCMVSAGGRVRLRETPAGELVRWLQPGSMVTVTAHLTVDGVRWARVGDGWVQDRYLSRITVAEEP